MSAFDAGAKIGANILPEAEQVAAKVAEALRGDSPLAAALKAIPKTELHLHSDSPSAAAWTADQFTIPRLDLPMTVFPAANADAGFVDRISHGITRQDHPRPVPPSLLDALRQDGAKVTMSTDDVGLISPPKEKLG
jgi:hypothetical protein